MHQTDRAWSASPLQAAGVWMCITQRVPAVCHAAGCPPGMGALACVHIACLACSGGRCHHGELLASHHMLYCWPPRRCAPLHRVSLPPQHATGVNRRQAVSRGGSGCQWGVWRGLWRRKGQSPAASSWDLAGAATDVPVPCADDHVRVRGPVRRQLVVGPGDRRGQRAPPRAAPRAALRAASGAAVRAAPAERVRQLVLAVSPVEREQEAATCEGGVWRSAGCEGRQGARQLPIKL